MSSNAIRENEFSESTVLCLLTQYVLMNSSFWIDTINPGLYILYTEGLYGKLNFTHISQRPFYTQILPTASLSRTA